jgi:hypothetical protein
MDTGATLGWRSWTAGARTGVRGSRPSCCARWPLADADIGDRHRQQDQVGEHDHRHADGGADGQLADHADVDDQQGDEAHGVGEDGDHPRQEQLAEGAPRGGQGVVRVAGLQGDAVDLLHPVGNADGEDQERHQHRVRVEPEAEECISPSCQTTATRVVISTAMVLRMQLVNQYSSTR